MLGRFRSIDRRHSRWVAKSSIGGHQREAAVHASRCQQDATPVRAADPKKSLVAPQKHGFRRQEPRGRGTWARSYPADQVSGRLHVSFGFDCQAHEVTSWLTDGSLDELAMKQGRSNPGSMWEMSQREVASPSSELALETCCLHQARRRASPSGTAGSSIRSWRRPHWLSENEREFPLT